jgi:uncharacterized delta-60 repeat protein
MAKRRAAVGDVLTLVTLAASLIALAVSPGMALAKPGALDRSFGDNGRVVTQTALGGHSWLDSSVHIAEGPGGTVVAAAGKAVFRYLSNGSLDPSFGDGGKLAVLNELEGMPFALRDMDVDSDGRVVLFGEVEVPDIRLPATYLGTTIPLTQAAIVRYDSSGGLDRSFGGGGAVVTDFGQPAYYMGATPPEDPQSPRYTKAVAGIADGNVNRFGGLTVLGRITVIEGCIRAAATAANRLVARFTPDGALDPSFGEGDGVASDLGFSDIWGIAETPDGGEMLTGRSIASRLCKGSPPGEAPVPELVSRLAPDGEIDSSFAANGFRSIPLTGPATAMAVDGGGRLDLMAGSTVLRLRQRGGLDRHFGGAGASVVSANHVDLDALYPIGHGRLILAGTHLVTRPNAARPNDLLPQSFAVTRRTSSGRPDRRFGHRGWVTTRFGKRSNVDGQEAIVDAEGRLVVAGPIARSDLAPTGGIALARYRLGPVAHYQIGR